MYTYTYDAEGNLASRTQKSGGQYIQYTYDHRNRLTAVVTKANSGGAETKRVEYLYDQADRRVARIVDPDGAGTAAATYTHYLFDDQTNVLLELSDADGSDTVPADVTHRYLHGPAVDQLLVDEADSGGGTEFRWALAGARAVASLESRPAALGTGSAPEVFRLTEARRVVRFAVARLGVALFGRGANSLQPAQSEPSCVSQL